MRCLQRGFTAFDIIHMASEVLCGTSDYTWSQSSGNQLALSHRSFSPFAFAASQWCLLVKCLLTQFLSSLPASPSSPHPLHFFVRSSFWHEALNISSAPLAFPLAHPALFMKPLFCLLKATSIFKVYLYKEPMCSTLCRHTGFQCAHSMHIKPAIFSCSEKLFSYFIISTFQLSQV